MRIGGQYVGIGLGDSGPEVKRIRAHMRSKFSYAKALKDTELFDNELTAAVIEMQRRYEAAGKLAKGKYTPGIINFATKIAMGLVPLPPPRDERPLLFSICGTGVPWWIGPDADTARAVESRYRWQPVGYPARAVPMGPSIVVGKAELERQFNIHRDQVVSCGAALAAYSQGAIVATEVFAEQIRPPNGRLHWAFPHLTKAVMWGNPSRQRGQVWPDIGGPASPATNGGVTDSLLTDTPKWWREYAHKGDLYADVPPDESGENRLAIWHIIRDGNFAQGPDSLFRQFLELGGIVRDAAQISEATAIFKAMIDAVMFFGSGTKAHVNYSTGEAIAYLMSR